MVGPVLIRAALGLCALQLLFFLWVAIFPLSTVGDPAFDRPMLRIRYWGATLQPWLWLATFAMLALRAILAQSFRQLRLGALALLPLLAAHLLIVAEGFWLISHGELAVDRDFAVNMLNLTRPACVILALLSLRWLWKFSATASDS